MKRKRLILGIFLLSLVLSLSFAYAWNSNPQSLSGDVRLEGYDSAHPNVYIQARDGTSNNLGMVLRTQKAGQIVEAMKIDYNGKVGIGTAYTGDSIFMVGDAGNQLNSGNYLAVIRTTSYTPDANSNLFAVGNSNGGIGTSGWQYFVVKGSGNVGIGTITPESKLQVVAERGNGISVSDSVYPDVTKVRLKSSVKGEGWDGSGVLELIRGDNVKSVYISAGGSSYFNGGNVGIGTANPEAPLHVKGKAIFESDVSVSGKVLVKKVCFEDGSCLDSSSIK